MDSPSLNSLTSRQESIGLTLPPNGVIVVGCGGVGSWVSQFLTLAGVGSSGSGPIWIFDPDIIEIHNLNRIPLPSSSVGQSKSLAMREHLLTLRPNATIFALGTFSAAMADILECGKADWLICTTDTWHSRRTAYDWAMANNVSYIEASAEGDVGGATGLPADFATPDELTPGYASVPVWIGPSVVSAYLAVSHVLHNMSMDDRTIRMGFTKVGSDGYKEFSIMDSDLEIVSQ